MLRAEGFLNSESCAFISSTEGFPARAFLRSEDNSLRYRAVLHGFYEVFVGVRRSFTFFFAKTQRTRHVWRPFEALRLRIEAL